MKCFAKRDSLTLEGQLRGDKGVKVDKSTGDGDNSAQEKYFYRALLLVRSEWKMFAMASACLVVGQLLALWSPSYQGKILDSVVHADTSTFNHVVVMYLAISVTSGAFQGPSFLTHPLILPHTLSSSLTFSHPLAHAHTLFHSYILPHTFSLILSPFSISRCIL